MPTYVYECPIDGCTEGQELVQSIKDESRPSCPRHGGKMQRVIQPTSFVLQGSGWARDGYRSGR